jgi:hypothetical protein
MSNDQPSPDKPDPKSKKMPEWMAGEAISHLEKSMRENPQLWIEAARYGSMNGGPGWENRMAIVISACDMAKVKSMPEWLHEVGAYSPRCDGEEGRTRRQYYDRPARALFVQVAISKLLKLVKAPEAIIEDLEFFLRSSQPKFSDKRAKIQAVLIEEPELWDYPSKLAKKAKCDHKLVERYLAEGSLQKPPWTSGSLRP